MSLTYGLLRSLRKRPHCGVKIDRTAARIDRARGLGPPCLLSATHSRRSPKLAQAAARLQPSAVSMPPSKKTRTTVVDVPNKRDQIISAWLRGVLEPRTNLAVAQRMVYPAETVFSAPYVTHITVRVEPALSLWPALLFRR